MGVVDLLWFAKSVSDGISDEQDQSLRVEMDKWEALAQAEADYWTARDREEARIEAFDHRDRFRHEIEEAARFGDAEDL